MANPLENKEFKHYLYFLNDRKMLIEISEPVKFDASEFFIGQDDGYARDLSFMNEEIELEFYEGFYEIGTTDYILPNGTITNKLSHCFEWLIEYDRLFGFQSQIQYILERNNVQFIVGELNFEGRQTDGLTYFKCKVVQTTNKALAKRRADTKIDGFATTDLDGVPISPLTATNILLKAKPVVQQSEWTTNDYTYSNSFFGSQPAANFPIFRNITKFGVDTTLTSFYNVLDNPTGAGSAATFFEEGREVCRFIQAENDLTDVVLTITGLNLSCNWSGLLPISKTLYVAWGTGYAVGEFDSEILFESDDNSINLINQDYTVNIPYVPNGGYISVVFSIFDQYTLPTVTPSSAGGLTINSGSTMNISLTATGVDTVIKGVRYKDVLNQSLKAINGKEVTAPEFEFGGEFYNLFCFSGNLIRQRDDVPFYFTFKDRRENLMLVNADCQINEDNAFALQYDKFYDNVDNGGFLLVPSDKFVSTYNEKYTINTFEYAFSTYETDRDESNTLDAVHTRSQWSINNTRVQNVKSVEVKDIFDPFSIESSRRQAYKVTTALDNDNKMHVMDCVPLAPSYRGGFTATMTHNVNSSGQLQLLKDADLPSWGLLGFGVGDNFFIDNTTNSGTFTVAEITDTVITLDIVSLDTPPAVALEPTSTKVAYYFTNVAYTNRTNENFDLIENVENPSNFGNLRYTIRRNMVHWESYIKTAALYITDDVRNTEFINNGLLVTQYDGGTIYTENADIPLDEMQDPILTPRLFDSDIIVEYDDALTLFSKYQDIDTVGGFIRIMDNNGAVRKVYPQSMRYSWMTKVMNIIGEERYETDIVTVERDGTNIVINEVFYSEETLPEVFFLANGDYVVLFDENNVNLINFTRYDKFIVQGETFENTNDLVQAIIDL